MRTMSFVDNFQNKNISIDTLFKILDVDYQRNILCQLAIKEYEDQSIKLTKDNDYFLRMESDSYSIYVLLSTENSILKEILKLSMQLNKKIGLIAFSKFDDVNNPNNIIFIDPLDWMNAIISNGIDKRILHLQYMRDMQFSKS